MSKAIKTVVVDSPAAIDSTQLIEFYQTGDGQLGVNVTIEKETVWLSLTQMAQLFERDKSVISRHLRKIFSEGELEEEATVAFFATVQEEGERRVRRDIEHFNLDAILSVGYRVNSKRGIDFRRWASSVLKQHLLQGYSLHEQKLMHRGTEDLEQAIMLLSNTLKNNAFISDMGQEVLKIIQDYTKTWRTLLAYDEQTLSLPNVSKATKAVLAYDYAISAIASLKTDLLQKGEASALFGQEREGQLHAILGNLEQSFEGRFLYPSW